MTALDLDGIKARAEAATPGPWEAHWQEQPGWVIDRIGVDDDDPGDEIAYLDSLSHADAAFIAESREDVPALIAEVERLTRVKDAALAQLDVSLEARDRRAEREVERLRAALTAKQEVLNEINVWAKAFIGATQRLEADALTDDPLARIIRHAILRTISPYSRQLGDLLERADTTEAQQDAALPRKDV